MTPAQLLLEANVTVEKRRYADILRRIDDRIALLEERRRQAKLELLVILAIVLLVVLWPE